MQPRFVAKNVEASSSLNWTDLPSHKRGRRVRHTATNPYPSVPATWESKTEMRKSFTAIYVSEITRAKRQVMYEGWFLIHYPLVTEEVGPLIFFFPAIYPAGLFFHKADWVRGGVSPLKTTVSLKAQEQVFMKTGEGEHGFPSVLVPSTQQEKVLEQQHCPTAPSALLQRNVYIYAAQYGSH